MERVQWSAGLRACPGPGLPIEGSTRPPPESRKDSPPFESTMSEAVTIGVLYLRPIEPALVERRQGRMVDFGVVGIGPDRANGEDALLWKPNFSKA